MVVTEAKMTPARIRELFAAKGGCQYSGEAVSQLEHALQCAALAEQAGAAAALITASLLHDVGHMTSTLEGTPTLRGEDDKHQYRGVVALKGVFPDAVLTPIRLHVDAKRYLCAIDPEYWANLSEDSKRSLVLQGGIYTREEAAEFIGQEHALDAVNLRRWDDLAKQAGRCTPDLEHFLAIANKCAA
jgi:phosphonate degradation associated HDIG domain protein